MSLPVRKQPRLKYYDYNSPGAYFITICTHEKRCFLSQISVQVQANTVGALHEAPGVPCLRLTDAGECVARILDELPTRFPMIELDRSVIMPNHIHLLLRITQERALREAPLQADGSRSLLSKAIGYLKMNSSKAIHQLCPGEIVWQRSFHEHVVRNEDDWRECAAYIDNNPARWAEDRL